MKRRIFLLLLLPFYGTAQDSVSQKMDELLKAYSNNKKFNGTVLVAQKGTVLYQKGFGYKNAEEKTMNMDSSIFQIGSITKQFTAAIIMQLQQEKRLSVKDKLSKYFSGFANGEKITIEHLLTHTSGIYNYTNDTVLMKSDVTRHYSADEMVGMFKNYKADFEPGTKWNYSNSGYSLLGYIIEKVEKKPYEKVVRHRILQPLGMTSSGFDFTHLKSYHKTKGYFAISDAAVIPAPIVDSTIAYAAGALYSTVGDLYKWEKAIYSDKILQPSSWKAVFTPFMNNYGYGWAIDTLFGKAITAHSGGIHGYASYLLRFPEAQLAVIVLDNSSTQHASTIARSLAAIVLKQPYEVPALIKEVMERN
jgi:CubicO group peptidase (beta-lactamase class C family)